MIYRIIRGKTNIKQYSVYSSIMTEEVEDVFSEEGIKKVIYKNLKNDSFISIFNIPDQLFNKIYEYIIKDASNIDIQKLLIEEQLPLFSVMLNIININKKHYKTLKNINNADKIIFECDANDFVTILQLCEKINAPVIIKGSTISLEEYYNILNNYDINKLSNKDIKIYYQEYNTPITIEELYNISTQINYITKKIKKYNLSPLEQIFLVFDIVKNNIYTKSNNSEDISISRTLNNVLNSDYIVCAGYVAIINAILKSLGHSNQVLLCNNKKHCRTMVYLKDNKYNIDGVYVFDPTFDKKKNEEDNYINNYEYFALPYEVANMTSNTPVFNILELSLLSLKDIYIDSMQDEKINKNTEIYNNIKNLFQLVGNTKYEYFIEKLPLYDRLSSDNQKELEIIYQEVKSKYMVSDIEINTFISALYKARSIEYYISEEEQKKYSSRISLPKVDEINTPEIKMAVIKRYCKIERLLNIDDNNGIKILLSRLYKEDLEDYLDNNLNSVISSSINEEIDRNILNMRLLKVLKKVKNM